MGAPRRSSSHQEKQLQELRAVFHMFDKDGSGSIDIHELQGVLRALGQHPTPVEMAELMQRMDANNNGVVEFEEFKEAMMGQAADEEMEQQLREVQEVFALFDADGSGSLSADEVQRALRILGVSLSAGETQLLISEIDANGDGEISCDELLQYVLSLDEDGAVGRDLEAGGGSPTAAPGSSGPAGRGRGVRSGVPTDAPLRLPPPSS